MKKTTIYLIRHCEVQNSDHVIYGRLPHFHLCSRGLYQADILYHYFEDKDISAIISSPLERTMETAEVISDGKIPVVKSKNIIEVNYKKWEGKRADQRDPAEVALYIKSPDKINLGETLPQLEKRMKKAITALVKEYRGKSIILVSHADPIIVARLSFEGKPLKDINKYEVRNASITTLEFDEKDKFVTASYKTIVDAKKDSP